MILQLSWYRAALMTFSPNHLLTEESFQDIDPMAYQEWRKKEPLSMTGAEPINPTRPTSLDAIPFIIGVAGHRDLVPEDLASLRISITAALHRLTDMASHSPCVLLSALAEGADQLVAELALELGWQVVAVLPMPLADFLGDFAPGEPQQRLLRLLDRCAGRIEIPWKDRLDPDVRKPRDQQYREQGIFLARQAQAVIVLWDGIERKPGDGACGTNLVVACCREGPPPCPGELLAAPEKTGLIHIPVRRHKAPQRALPHVVPSPSDAIHEGVFKAINHANRDLAAARQSRPADIDQARGWLIPPGDQGVLDPGSTYLADRFAELDVLAIVYQRQRKQVIQVASAATIIAALSQATYGVLAAQPWIIAYGVAIALAYTLYFLLFWLPIFQLENHFLEYRAIAEATRVQLFWRLAGLDQLVAEHYLQLVKSNVGWVREAARALGFMSYLLTPRPQAQPALVETHWIQSQERYFIGDQPPQVSGNARKRRRLQRRFDLSAWVAMTGGALLVALAGGGYVTADLAVIEEWASSYSASLFFIAAVLKGYAETLGYGEEADSFEMAGGLYRNARHFLREHAGDEELFRACVKELGKHALNENAEWLLLHRRNAFKIEQ